MVQWLLTRQKTCRRRAAAIVNELPGR